MFTTKKITNIEESFIKIVGKAVFLSQRIEGRVLELYNMISFTLLNENKSADELSEELIKEEKNYRTIGRLIYQLEKKISDFEKYGDKQEMKRVELVQEILEVIKVTKDSRNYIAHDSLKSFFYATSMEIGPKKHKDNFLNNHARKEFNVLKEHIINLIKAIHMIDSIYLDINYNGEVHFKYDYIEKDILHWVYKDIDEELLLYVN